MRLLVDEGVPQAVAELFRQRGHDVHSVGDSVPRQSRDPVIAAAADELSAIVVTWDYRHFRRLASRAAEGQQRFRKLGRICFRLEEAQAEGRLQKFMEYIEFEYTQAQKRNDKRVMIDITSTTFTVIA